MTIATPARAPALLALALLGGCAATTPALRPGDPAAPSQVTPSEALAIARELTTHPWRPFAGNILHGKDRAGIEVQTPDASLQTERPGWWLPGEVNSGLPYQWGGFDNPATFDAAIASGRAGGDISSPEKRRLDQAAVSTQAAGVDCSGFVSRCLKLPSVHDSLHLPALCDVLTDPRQLHPGDLLNIPHRHVILCAGWANPAHTWLYYYETGGPPVYWKPGLKQAPLEALLVLGYQPLRYRGMATEARTDGKEVLTRGLRERAAMVEHPVVGEP